MLSGEIPPERLDDSVERILKIKDFAKCGQKKEETQFIFQSVGRKIAEKSVTLVNNYNNLFPVEALNVKKVLLITASRDRSVKNDLKYIAELLEDRGIKVIIEERLWIPRLLELEQQVDLTIFAIYEGVSSDMPGPVCITGDEAVNIWASQKADPQKNGYSELWFSVCLQRILQIFPDVCQYVFTGCGFVRGFCKSFVR